MTTQSQDLQATHQILNLLETSKNRSDDILDTLPGIFAVVRKEPSAVVLRGNSGLAFFFSTPHEHIIGKHFSSLFIEERWNIFLSQIEKLDRTGASRIEFELPITWTTEERPFYWQVRKFENETRKDDQLVTIIGNDISELRRAEQQIKEMFASIPLGIFSVDKNGLIEPRYSTHLEWLLGSHEIAGQHFKTILFDKCWEEHLTSDNRQAIDVLVNSLGQPVEFFEIVRNQLPTQIFFPLAGANEVNGRYLDIIFHPVIFGGMIERLLVVLHDRTALEVTKHKEEQMRILEEQDVSRIIQLKRCSADIVQLIVDELEVQFQKLEQGMTEQNARNVAVILHSIKGNARIGGFERMMQLTHDLEDFLKSQTKGGQTVQWDLLFQDMEGLKSEWSAIKKVYQALYQSKKPDTEAAASLAQQQSDKSGEMAKMVNSLFDRYNRLLAQGYTPETALLAERISLSLQSFSYVPLNSLNELLQARVTETARSTGREVKLEFSAENVRVNESCRNSISEVLLHMINNSLSHGIELPEVRIKKKKNREGTIKVTFKENMGLIEGTLEDDGAGIDVEKVKRVALSRGWLNLEDSLRATREQLLSYIFRAGFSTADRLTATSGRGVGLDAVSANLEKFGGKIKVTDREPCGTQFTFSLRSSEQVPVQKSIYSQNEIVKTFSKAFELMKEHEGFEIICDAKAMDGVFDKGLVYCDLRRLSLAATVYAGHLADNGVVEAKFEKGDNGLAHCLLFKKQGASGPVSSEPRAEYSLPLVICEDYISQHMGRVLKEGDQIKLTFGTLLTPEDVGDYFYLIEEKADVEAVKVIEDGLLEVAKEMGVGLKRIYLTDKVAPSRQRVFYVGGTGTEDNFGILPVGVSKMVIRKEFLRVVGRNLGISEIQ